MLADGELMRYQFGHKVSCTTLQAEATPPARRHGRSGRRVGVQGVICTCQNGKSRPLLNTVAGHYIASGW